MIHLPKILVAGGVSRKAGKTRLIEAIMRAFPEGRWTAVKISSDFHPQQGEARLLASERIRIAGAEPGTLPEAGYRLWEETDARPVMDTGRFLAAGAERALLLETGQASAGDAAAKLLEILNHDGSPRAVCETTSAAPLLSPCLFLMAVSGGAEDWKISTRELLPVADALVVMREDARMPENLTGGPVFRIEDGGKLPCDLRRMIEGAFFALSG